MLVNQPSLGDQLATLRASAEAIPAPAWLPEALHALILACLLRLFGRLESMISHWQAGLLPPPPQPRLASPARHAAPRPAPPRPSLLARLAAFLAARPHTTPAPASGPCTHARSSTRMDRAVRARHAVSTAGNHENTKPQGNAPRDRNADTPPPSRALALPCFFVSLCLCGRLLPSLPRRTVPVRRSARAPPAATTSDQRTLPLALNIPVT